MAVCYICSASGSGTMVSAENTRAAVVLRLGTLAALLFLASQAYCTVLVPLTPQQLAQSADAIVVGTVTRIAPRSAPGRQIVTEIDVRVDMPVKLGRAGETIRLTVPGGTLGGITEYVHGTPDFHVREQVLVYVQRLPNGDLGVLGWRQGKWRVEDGCLAGSRVPLEVAVADIRRHLGPQSTLSGGAPKGQAGPGLQQRLEVVSLPRTLPRAVSPPDPGKVGTTTPRPPLRLTADIDIENEGFEGAWPDTGWTVSGSPTWDDTSYRAYSGSWSAWCADTTVTPPGPYPPGMNAWADYGPFSLSDATEAHLEFSAWLKTETTYDTLFYGVSGDGVNYSGRSVSGGAGTWYDCPGDLTEANFSSVLGDSSVWIAFVFQSDSSIQYEGAYIDDIRLWKRTSGTPTITSISPSPASGNTSTLVTIAGSNFGSSTGTVRFPWGGTTYNGTISSWADTQIRCYVPTAESGDVVVRTSGGVNSPSYHYPISFTYLGMKIPNSSFPDLREYNTAGTPDAANEFLRLDTSFLTWTGVSSCFAHSRFGGYTTTNPGTNDTHPVLGWLETGWPWSSEAIAVTVTWYSGSNILHHDVAYNGQYFTWSDSGAGGAMDIENITTHELGHWWGLNDLYGGSGSPNDSAKTMYGYSSAGETSKRSLDTADQLGIQWIYPGKPGISVNPTSLSFAMDEGGANPSSQSVTLTNTGSGQLSWYAVTSDSWISVSPTYGTGTSISVSANGSGKTAGTYNGSVTLYLSPGASGSPKSIPVTLTVNPTTYSISGDVDLSDTSDDSGVTVTAGSRSATTAADGTYTITGLPSGTYTVTPSKAEYDFTPASRSVAVGPNQTGVDFAGTRLLYTISGDVDLSDTSDDSGVTVTAGSRSATTAADGTYTITGLPSGTYTVTPSKAEYDFTPASRSVAVGPNQTGVDFAGTRLLYTISGDVDLNDTSDDSGVTVTAGSRSATTAADGTYTITGLLSGTYTVTPSKPKYDFAPTNRSVTVGPDQGGVNFTGTRPTLSWAGTTGHETDGVDPDRGTPNSTTFTFRVKYTDPTGAPPSFAKGLVQRKDCGAGWHGCATLTLTKESGDIATGAIYSGSTQLPNVTLKYRFRFKASAGAPVAGEPNTWLQGPLITGVPHLCWTGATGFGTDGVTPDSGPLGTSFQFQVQYADSAGDAPTTCQLVIRRNGKTFRQKTMSAAPAGDLRLGKVYRTSVTLTQPGNYRYRFTFADVSGTSLGTGSKWCAGPTISGGATSVVSALAAAPTNAGAQVAFSLSSSANVTATVVNVAGRPIRTIAADQPLDAGLQTLLWDRRSENGLAVPPGLYLIRLTARSEDGAQSNALATLSLR